MASNWNKNNGGGKMGQKGEKVGQKRVIELPPETTSIVLPDNYVDLAEQNMRMLFKKTQKITTTKIRNLLSLITDCYQMENRRWEDTIASESVTALMNLRVRLAYEYGRDYATKDFIIQTKLLEYLSGIQNRREAFIRFFHYVEALVAYHRYLGGRE